MGANFKASGLADAGHEKAQNIPAISDQWRGRMVPGGQQLLAQAKDRRSRSDRDATGASGIVAE